MTNSETILSQQVHPGDSTIETVTGNAFKGDGYFNSRDGLHTIQYSITEFKGTVNIQASLATMPSEQDWFTVYTQFYSVNNDSMDPLETRINKIENFTGNYVWVRAKITDWTEGSVTSIKLNH